MADTLAQLGATSPKATPAPFRIPDSAYQQVPQFVQDLDPAYWAGYQSGMAARGIIPPVPAGADWRTYITGSIWPLYRSQANGGYPSANNVGFDNALEDGALCRFHRDPASPGYESWLPPLP
jgi:hypothetical protein